MISPEDQELVTAYRAVFMAPAGQKVLLDMMRHCKFRRPCDDDVQEGMRRAVLRILEMSQLTDEQLLKLYTGQTIRGETQ